ncbi:hypothetical protein EDB83DRAFT_1524545 [Lactarius deliciosus]|nr:hypothetical protein EDB83DRAFT_1524545 [Lactarius deliciosus]
MSDKARDATRTSSSVLEIDHVRLPYRHLVIQAAFDVTWFRNSAGDGVVYHEQFSPVPVPAIAFVLTVIECCIDEWAGGLHQETGWDKERFKTVYRSHISSLGDFQRHAIGDTLEHIQSDLLKEARKHADVPPVPITKLRGFTQTL